MKRIVLMLVVLMAMLNVTLVYADGDSSLNKQLSDLLLINNETAKDNIINASNNYIEELIASEYEFWISVKQESKAAAYEEYIRERSTIDVEKTFCFYQLDNAKYSKQYADNYNFEYLINPTKLWYPLYDQGGTLCYFDDKTSEVVKIKSQIIDKAGREFLYNTQKIEELVEDNIEEKILDCKIVVLVEKHIAYTKINDPTSGKEVQNVLATVIYLKGETTDYGIKIYTIDQLKKEDSYLDDFKVYTMAEIIQSTGEYERIKNKEMLETKETYQTEAESLQRDGILQGTDKGLELLKPLSRIEATTILVRILGLENQATSATSYFADISSDNWGAKYANIAYDAGITKGVDNGNFAPNQTITSSQFVTLLLRSQGETEIDWQTAINLLVEREIITQAQADKMDLFTRGDMAKIIYEFRNKGLINN